MGVIETLEAFTGMASYIRIMAVGLAGAIFAEAINEIVVEMAQSTAMLVLAVLVAVVLHGLNFIIACVQPRDSCNASQLPGVLQGVLRDRQHAVQSVHENRR